MNLQQKIAERDRLTREITAEQRDRVAEVWHWLDEVALALQDFSVLCGHTWVSSERKNVKTVALGRVAVDLAYPHDGYSSYVEIRNDAGSVRFDWCQPVPVLLAVARAMLENPGEAVA